MVSEKRCIFEKTQEVDRLGYIKKKKEYHANLPEKKVNLSFLLIMIVQRVLLVKLEI